MKLRDIIGVRKDMPDLTDEERDDLRERLVRDHETSQRLREAIEKR